MREMPSDELVGLLDRLALATEDQIVAARRHARRLAPDLPRFDSVWVDALVAARRLTPFQAAQINTGRGAELQVGPYVLVEPRFRYGYAESYRGQEIQTRRAVEIAIITRNSLDSQRTANALKELVATHQRMAGDSIAAIERSGTDDERMWIVSQDWPGTSAAEWLLREGRCPPEAVLEIARQMAAALSELEARGGLHSDVGPANLRLTAEGRMVLAWAGLRAAVRPEEGYAHADLPPEAYDYLAPERVEKGTPPDTSSDLYACGCTWWHLLAGRPPLAGGNSLAKVKSAHQAKILDIRRLAPDTPAPLAAAIAACIHRDPGRRPPSMAKLAAALGPPTRQGRLALAHAMARRRERRAAVITLRSVRQSPHVPVWLAGSAGGLLMAIVLSWPWWRANVVIPMAKAARRTELVPLEKHEQVPYEDRVSRQPSRQTEQVPSYGNRRTEQVPFYEDRDEESSNRLASYDMALVPSPVDDRDGSAADRSAVKRKPERAAREADLLLPSDTAIEAGALRLRPRQSVRPADGGRAQVVVSNESMVVEAEDVIFENIDFVGRQDQTSTERRAKAPALIVLGAGGAEFQNCSFRATPKNRRTALEWSEKNADVRSEDNGFGRLLFVDCVFENVERGIDCRMRGSFTIELENSLFLGDGQWWRLDRPPGASASVLIALDRCTLRASRSLGEIDFEPGDLPVGEITIEATDSVFAPHAEGQLLCLAGPVYPEGVMEKVRWTGQGSMLKVGCQFAVWSDRQRGEHALDDSGVAIEGLSGGSFEFAGEELSEPADSEIRKWAAPIQSDKPPGIRSAALAGRRR